MATMVIYASTPAGQIQSGPNTTYAAARAGDTFTVDTAASFLNIGQNIATSTYLYESFIGFVVFEETYSDATLGLYAHTTGGGGCQVRSQSYGPTLAQDDWVPGADVSSLPLLGTGTMPSGGGWFYITIDPGDLVVGARNEWMLVSSNFVTGTEVSLSQSVRGVSYSGTTYDPVLTLTWTPQYIRPDADIATTGWSTAPLWSKVDEESADGVYISATAV